MTISLQFACRFCGPPLSYLDAFQALCFPQIKAYRCEFAGDSVLYTAKNQAYLKDLLSSQSRVNYCAILLIYLAFLVSVTGRGAVQQVEFL